MTDLINLSLIKTYCLDFGIRVYTLPGRTGPLHMLFSTDSRSDTILGYLLINGYPRIRDHRLLQYQMATNIMRAAEWAKAPMSYCPWFLVPRLVCYKPYFTGLRWGDSKALRYIFSRNDHLEDILTEIPLNYLRGIIKRDCFYGIDAMSFVSSTVKNINEEKD